jgi:hypothetical protein
MKAYTITCVAGLESEVIGHFTNVKKAHAGLLALLNESCGGKMKSLPSYDAVSHHIRNYELYRMTADNGYIFVVELIIIK